MQVSIDKTLSDFGDEYLELIGAERRQQDKDEIDKNYRWTGVVSTAHFTIAGCLEIRLKEDVDDAWAEIEAIHQDGVPPFEFIFDAKDCELPNSVKNLEPYRLPDD